MSKEYTAKEAAKIVGVADSRIRQLCLGDNAIDHRKFGQMLVITELGLTQAKLRNTKKGPRFKTNPTEVNP